MQVNIYPRWNNLYPACYNPILAEERRQKREKLLSATQKGLEKIAKEVAR
jgi:hypothetical protein